MSLTHEDIQFILLKKLILCNEILESKQTADGRMGKPPFTEEKKRELDIEIKLLITILGLK